MLNLQNHSASLVGAILGIGTSLGLTTGAVPGAEHLPVWGQIGLTLLGGLVPLAVGELRRWFRGRAASDRVKVAQLRNRAKTLRSSGLQNAVEQAAKLEEQADQLEADAAAAEAQAAEK